jgi:hypothetical protein
MHGLFALIAPAALMVPMLAGAGTLLPAAEPGGAPRPAPPGESLAARTDEPLPNPLTAFYASVIVQQVRIEQRVVIRISPQPLAARNNLLADLPDREVSPRFQEREKAKCVPLEGIAGVQTGSGNRLVLFLRDRRMISVNLEKSCRARDFYSGFYVEKNKDGRLCVDRDKLQSRTGARCEVEAMRSLVEVRD